MTAFSPQTLYELLGGAEGVRALVDAFYDVMDRDPRAQEIRAMHPADLAESRDKLYEFLSGWTGGPALYHERRGHPRLRFRHLPFPIGRDQAAQWLYCMNVAIQERGIPPHVEERLMQGLTMTAHHMINREE
ncbi:MAG TPA: group II truncated hemoglobin [Gammaproteobacteria bacterium]|nr:group II truncated hemoglobin [Gammaproteobacteria bacterium]